VDIARGPVAFTMKLPAEAAKAGAMYEGRAGLHRQPLQHALGASNIAR